MHIVCSDLEGIFLPEIWITFAEKSGIQVRIVTNSLASSDGTAVHSGYARYREELLPAGATGWKGLRQRPDVVGTEDGLAKHPYIRESRRIRAEFTVLEQHVSTEFRMKETGAARQEVKAAEFKDSLGIGSYRIDLHPSSGGDNYIEISSLPFQIPLGALLPCRVENLLPACKNLGVTHIANGCYRLHPVEWNIGEAAGALAAHSLETGRSPRGVRGTAAQLEEFQGLLDRAGVELHRAVLPNSKLKM